MTNNLQQTLEHGLLKANVSNKNLYPSDSNRSAAAFQTVQQPKPAIPVLPLPLEIINNNNGQIGSNYRHSIIKRKIHLKSTENLDIINGPHFPVETENVKSLSVASMLQCSFAFPAAE